MKQISISHHKISSIITDIYFEERNQWKRSWETRNGPRGQRCVSPSCIFCSNRDFYKENTFRCHSILATFLLMIYTLTRFYAYFYSPEALGIVPGAIFLICLIFCLVGYATSHPTKVSCESILSTNCTIYNRLTQLMNVSSRKISCWTATPHYYRYALCYS